VASGELPGPYRVNLRIARPHESEWINERYQTVDFLPSDLNRDTVVVAEIDGMPAGIGRLVPIGDDACELGGMLVFEEFRGRGVARAIIDELLRRAGGRDVYCIPFAELQALYATAGFVRCDDAPAPVREKYEWCRTTYDQPVLLMKRTVTT
jgi:GNAT superfamily N-acetyltransferase